jgi:hypothetical protein
VIEEESGRPTTAPTHKAFIKTGTNAQSIYQTTTIVVAFT